MLKIKLVISCMLVNVIFQSSFINAKHFGGPTPKAMLIPSKKFSFNSFVDCNMAEAWIGDILSISAPVLFAKVDDIANVVEQARPHHLVSFIAASEYSVRH